MRSEHGRQARTMRLRSRSSSARLSDRHRRRGCRAGGHAAGAPTRHDVRACRRRDRRRRRGNRARVGHVVGAEGNWHTTGRVDRESVHSSTRAAAARSAALAKARSGEPKPAMPFGERRAVIEAECTSGWGRGGCGDGAHAPSRMHGGGGRRGSTVAAATVDGAGAKRGDAGLRARTRIDDARSDGRTHRPALRMPVVKHDESGRCLEAPAASSRRALLTRR